MNKILIAGDIHGDTIQVEYLIRMAKANDCDRILQVGDFGYWPHTQDGQNFLRKSERMLRDANLTLYWIDGNHENFHMLSPRIRANVYSPIVLADNTWKITDCIRYIPRGHTWEWNGVKFLAMGGAISVDRDARTLGKSYWPQEALTEQDVKRGISAAQNGSQSVLAAYLQDVQDEVDGVESPSLVDVLICHDAPTHVNVPQDGGWNDFITKMKSLDQDTRYNRLLLTDLVEAVRPKQIYHGHYHVRHSNPYSRPGLEIPCEGLNCNGSVEESWIIFERLD